MLTYSDLLAILQKFSPDELQQTATIHLVQSDEFFGVESVETSDNADVLDKGHKTINIPA